MNKLYQLLNEMEHAYEIFNDVKSLYRNLRNKNDIVKSYNVGDLLLLNKISILCEDALTGIFGKKNGDFDFEYLMERNKNLEDEIKNKGVDFLVLKPTHMYDVKTLDHALMRRVGMITHHEMIGVVKKSLLLKINKDENLKP